MFFLHVNKTKEGQELTLSDQYETFNHFDFWQWMEDIWRQNVKENSIDKSSRRFVLRLSIFVRNIVWLWESELTLYNKCKEKLTLNKKKLRKNPYVFSIIFPD